MYFQHDGAPPHYTIRVREFLNEIFPNRWLGRGGPVVWPPRSPDLTPLDYYLWGHMKTLFAAAEQIRNHPHNNACATGSLKIRAENCIATGGGTLNKYSIRERSTFQ